jgi:hypothetical protein
MSYSDIYSGVAAYIDFMVDDYAAWTNRSLADRPDFAKERIEEFKNGFSVRVGKKYIKIVSDNSVKAFIVNTDDDKKFKKGDLLKPAGFAAPARNSARGNVLEGRFSGRWTGPEYLK